MTRRTYWLLAVVATFAMLGTPLAWSLAKGNKKKGGEQERKVTAAELPDAALAAIKKQAGNAKLTAFSEEIEFGHTFYEGTCQNAAGHKIDILVTAAGDLVEIEEKVEGEQVPAAALAAARKAAGKDAPLRFEKKTMVLYEAKFRKGDRRHELLLTPDGRRVEEEIEKGKREAGDEDEDAEEHEGHHRHHDGDRDDDDDDDNEHAVTLDQVPVPVKRAILKAAGDHKITELEVEGRGNRKVYEAEWKANGKEIEIAVAPNGKVLKKEVEDDDDDNDDDDNDDDDN